MNLICNSELSVLFGVLTGKINFMKDTLEVSIIECLDAIFKKLEAQTDKMNSKFIGGEKSVLIDKIEYIESQKHRLIFYIFEPEVTEYSIYAKLDDIEVLLKENKFLRIHKSYLVNMRHIIKANNYKVALTSGQELSIPKLRYRAVKEALSKIGD
jgi:two-component system, LytTR family, response regulator LytT